MRNHNQQEEFQPDETGIMARKNTVRVPFTVIITVLGLFLSGAGWLVNGVTTEIRTLNAQFADYRATTERRLTRLEVREDANERLLDDHTRRDLEARGK